MKAPNPQSTAKAPIVVQATSVVVEATAAAVVDGNIAAAAPASLPTVVGRLVSPSHASSPPFSDVAIATTWDGVQDYACAVLPWCQQAERLADLLVHGVGVRSAQLLMLVTEDHRFSADEESCKCRFQRRRFCPEC